jgi:hypothetical protein
MRWFGLLLMLVVLIVVFLRRASAPEPPVLPDSEVRFDVVGDLELRAEIERLEGARRLRLISENGAAVFVLEDASSSELFAFGEARVEPLSPREGGGFLGDVAGWLGQSVPPVRPGTLEPFPFSYALLGERDGWEANKVFFEFGVQYAEVYLNIGPDGTRARLLEKDPDYAADLVALLAMAVRDGKPPRRSMATDPHLASDAVLFPTPRPLAVPGTFKGGPWSAQGFLGVVDYTRVVRWATQESEPEEIATLPRILIGLSPAPAGSPIAALVVYSQRKGSYSSSDPTEVFLIEPGKEPRSLLRSEPSFHLMSHARLVWSPDGTRLAASAPVDGTTRRRSRVRIIEVASARVLHETDLALDLDEVSIWTASGLELVRHDWAGPKLTETHFTWEPAKSGPQRVPTPPGPRSPDGLYAIVVADGGVLEVRGPDGTRTFESADAGDRKVIEMLPDFDPVWCGPHHLVLDSGDPVLLDLATLKTRLLLPARGWNLVDASPDGREVLCTSPDGLPHWAVVR